MKTSTIKILDPLLSQGFTPIPNIILRSPKISMQNKALYALLLSYAWFDAHCFPGQERVAKDLGVTDRTVRTLLKELKEHGLIDWTQRGLNKSNIYYILPITGQERKTNSVQKHTHTSDYEYEGYEDEVKAHGRVEVAPRVSTFQEYCTKNEVSPTSIYAIRYYLQEYYRCLGKHHPMLNKEAWENITHAFDYCSGEYDIHEDGWETIITNWFEVTGDKLSTDFNILHFTAFSDGNFTIISNRYFELLY